MRHVPHDRAAPGDIGSNTTPRAKRVTLPTEGSSTCAPSETIPAIRCRRSFATPAAVGADTATPSDRHPTSMGRWRCQALRFLLAVSDIKPEQGDFSATGR